MKPHTAVIIILIAWITLAILNTTPFYEFIFSLEHGTCVPLWTEETLYLVFSVIVLLILIGVIVITSIWTCCFTRRFLQQHEAGSNIYVSKNRRIIGIFGSLLLACGLCFGPGVLTAIITIFTFIPYYAYVISVFCFYCVTIANPLVQSFFRPDVRDTVKYMFSKCSSCTSSDTVNNHKNIV